jgi:uncharacterized protein YjlB
MLQRIGLIASVSALAVHPALAAGSQLAWTAAGGSMEFTIAQFKDDPHEIVLCTNGDLTVILNHNEGAGLPLAGGSCITLDAVAVSVKNAAVNKVSGTFQDLGCLPCRASASAPK